MSHENVEVVRAMFDAFSSGDPDGTNVYLDQAEALTAVGLPA